MSDPFNLERFLEVQSLEYQSVLQELRLGEKLTHWMWFVFPQVKGLGDSPMAQEYAITSLDEAREYLEHEVLGPRLEECTGLVLEVEGKTANQIFGHPDDLKFRSCMTLFAQCAPENRIFNDALVRFFDGAPDPLTLGILRDAG